MNKMKEQNSITLCKRAGKLVVGLDLVKASMQLGEAEIFIIASDISEKTSKEVLFLAENYEYDVVGTMLTMDELWYSIGKRAGVLAIADAGLARGYLKSEPTVIYTPS